MDDMTERKVRSVRSPKDHPKAMITLFHEIAMPYPRTCPIASDEPVLQMTNLPITNPAPIPRETLYSYLARLAAIWRTEAPNLAYDIGAPFKRLLDQDEDALEAFADWAKLSPEAMTELLSWTGTRAGNVRMEFRGELYIEVVLVLRPLCSPVKVDQDFMSGCHSHGLCFALIGFVWGQDAVGRMGPLGIVIGQPFADALLSL